jgi:PAS domain-containing protein
LEQGQTMLAYQTFQIIFVSLTIICIGLILLRRRGLIGPLLGAPQTGSTGPTFLFKCDALIDATPEADRILTHFTPGKSDLDTVVSGLGRHFQLLPQTLQDLTDTGVARLPADDDTGLELRIERQDTCLRLGLIQEAETPATTGFSPIERGAMEAEIALLQDLTGNAPQLIWREDCSGTLMWANAAYIRAADHGREAGKPSDSAWPAESIFPTLSADPVATGTTFTSRQTIAAPGTAQAHWFEVTRIGVPDGTLNYAVDASATVKAEMAQKAFMQTLGKTFANLSIGLAVFDRHRKLTLFNPAIVELTGLSAAFLSARPTVGMVLDRLREARKLPELRDYASFRDRFSALERAVERGPYTENWMLPDGQTLKVTGRPHPDGGLAFNFEDITAEISLTRRFRSEIETSQAVLDGLPEAVAVFSQAQSLVMWNTAYSDLWGIDGGVVGVRQDLRDALRLWKTRSVPTKAWRDIEGFAMAQGVRSHLSLNVVLMDGRQARCDVQSLANGVTMVRFGLRRGVAMPAPALLPTVQGRRAFDR